MTRSAVVPGLSECPSRRNEASNAASAIRPAAVADAAGSEHLAGAPADAPGRVGAPLAGDQRVGHRREKRATPARRRRHAEPIRRPARRRARAARSRTSTAWSETYSAAIVSRCAAAAIASRSVTRGSSRTSCSTGSSSPPAPRQSDRRVRGPRVGDRERAEHVAKALAEGSTGHRGPREGREQGARSRGWCWRRRPPARPARLRAPSHRPPARPHARAQRRARCRCAACPRTTCPRSRGSG